MCVPFLGFFHTTLSLPQSNRFGESVDEDDECFESNVPGIGTDPLLLGGWGGNGVLFGTKRTILSSSRELESRLTRVVVRYCANRRRPKRRMCPLRVKVNAWLGEWICDSDDTLVILNVSERLRWSRTQGYGERRPIM